VFIPARYAWQSTREEVEGMNCRLVADAYVWEVSLTKDASEIGVKETAYPFNIAHLVALGKFTYIHRKVI
jgi:hypothetical protein